MSVVLEVQKSLYAKLTGDSALMVLVTGVYDYVPEGAELPYVTIGDIGAADDSAKGRKGYELDVNLEVYSQGQGRKECLDIIGRLKVLLDNQALTITGFVHIFSKVVRIETRRSADNLLANGLMAMKIFVKDN